MIEKAISYQLTNYLRDNDLEESLQSAYKTFHGTKTTLVKVHNDIVSEIDNQSYVILLLLDLSAVFDTVDHKIVLQRLSCRFGIDGKTLRWFKSYRENRKQVVNVKGSTSCSNWGVAYPKDLCWGLYCMYCTRPRLATLSEVMAYHVISTLMTPSLTAHSSFMIKQLQCKQLSLV